MAELVEQGKGGGKQKEKRRPRRLHPYGGHDDASYYVLHALYLFGQAPDDGIEYA